MNLAEFIFNSNTLVGIGAVIFALSYLVKNFLLGNKEAEKRADKVEHKSDQARQELTDIYEKQLAVTRAENKQLSDRMLALEKQLSELKGKLDAYQSLIKDPQNLEQNIRQLTSTVNKLVESSAIADDAKAFMEDVRSGKVKLRAE